MEKDKPSGNQTNVSQTETTNSIAVGHIEKVVIATQPNRGFNGIHVGEKAINSLVEDNYTFDNFGHGISVDGQGTIVRRNISEGNGYPRRPPEKRTVIHMATKPPKPEPGI